MESLLYLVHRIPYPPNKGDKIRSYHFLRAICQRYKVYLGTFVDDPEDKKYIGDLQNYCEEIFCPDLNPKLGKLKSLSGLLSGEALSLPYYRNTAMQVWVDKTIAAQSINKALIFSSPMAQYLEGHPDVKLIADFVDVDSDKWRQYASSKAWPASWIYGRESVKLLQFEAGIAQRADATLFVSEQEAELFKQLLPDVASKIGYVCNGVDTEAFDPSACYPNPFAETEQAIVFTGAMDYWANVDAVVWFAQEVFPKVKAGFPGARFYIVGSKPDKRVLELSQTDSDVVVTGRVDDVKTYLAHARVVVAPLRIARGIQNKVLEAMAMAKPLVVTSAAMEGISGNGDIEVSVTDDADRFAAAVGTSLRAEMAPLWLNRRFVQENYAWAYNGSRLCEFLAATGTGHER
ncbi:TIGR03087 family PEP-CTERM/XrtA system glycosyltransferase [Methylomonas rhizoryzae]|uniref:TIGR03087 family PEP-CTERM/XrtA system glycosyltransferase n=1 Tax=Methylomonas rhizoryzae TaxID=2608981 RepID=UPI0012325A41|nr:TIGR03087 family PEP-CTERM/XrtA system glycosyltransferase [Methylomonas rhizoryzae]